MACLILMSYQSRVIVRLGMNVGRSTTPAVQVAAVSALRAALPLLMPAMETEARVLFDGLNVAGLMPSDLRIVAQFEAREAEPCPVSPISHGSVMKAKSPLDGA